jgi:Nif-specific regulatory protein
VTEELERHNKKLSILYEIALTVGRSLDLKTILNDVLEKIIGFMGVDAGVIYVIDNKTLEMIPVAFKNLSEEVVKDLCERKVRVGECMCGNIAKFDEEVIIFEKASQDPRFTRAVLKREGMEFYAGLPLKSKGRVVGVLCVITHEPYFPAPDLIDVLRAATIPIGLAIENAFLFETTKKEADLQRRLSDFEGIITSSPSMLSILDLLRKVKDLSSTILIYGESGTGKELIAKAIHFNSLRKDKPFIVVNCAAIPENLIESELFGYIKGAFTGAYTEKKGLFEAADGGTIFLDEVEAISKNLQVKLLRFLQDKTFFKVGSTKQLTVDVRIIAATNQRLEELVRTKQFREDLFYRLNVIKVELPPLRERPEDIPILVRYFINKYSSKMNKAIRQISHEAMSIIMNYQWPGNIRELENVLERAVALSETEEIKTDDLPLEIMPSIETRHPGWSLREIKKDLELEHIRKALALTGGNRKKAAELLGLDTTTLWRKLKRLKKL